MKLRNAFIIAAALVVGSAALVSSTDADDELTHPRRGLRKDKKKKVFASTPKKASQATNRIGITGRENGIDRPNKFRMAEKNGVKDQYIVVLEDFVDEQDIEALADSFALIRNGKRKGKAFRRALKGFAINLSQEEAEILSQTAEVKYVEQDAEITKNQALDWGLDRIDQRDLPLDSKYSPNGDGTGVTAYIFDTGIRTTHNEFGGRATWGANPSGDDSNEDCDGHGTHVAGTVGGATYGVAKNVDLVAVKVFTCAGVGYSSTVIAGLEYVKEDCPKRGGSCVINMSLGGGPNTPEDEAINSAVEDGIPVVVAAGNDNADACNYSPARAAGAITVGSTTDTDARSSFSNYGTCVDIFAPGSSITAAYKFSDTSLATISGTSMASPHVAGIAAILLGNGISSAQATSLITSSGTSNKVTSQGTGSPNLLAYISNETSEPSSRPSSIPTAVLSSEPSSDPSSAPSTEPSSSPSSLPSTAPVEPSAKPSNHPTLTESERPSLFASSEPSVLPSLEPSMTASALPSADPSVRPSNTPSFGPSEAPTGFPTTPEPTLSNAPSTVYVPSASPSISFSPSVAPSEKPSDAPSVNPTETESNLPSLAPSISPSAGPTAEPSANPSVAESLSPSTSPSGAPSLTASAEPTLSEIPSSKPSPADSQSPSLSPTAGPSNTKSSSPSSAPSATISATPSNLPTETPPSSAPTKAPTKACRKRQIDQKCRWNKHCCSGNCAVVGTVGRKKKRVVRKCALPIS